MALTARIRDQTRCHVCGGPRHPRVHIADPTSYGLPLRRRDDGQPTSVQPFVPVWKRRLSPPKETR
jgi:hypothetical protein